jgi:hypothetical protein
MPLSPRDRITMIRECATLLDKEEWADVDLILDQHGFMTSGDWRNEGKRDYVIAMVKDALDDSISGLHGYLTSESDTRTPGQSPFKSDRLRVFFSHLAAQRELVGDVARGLARYGVDAFVAHDDIEPSREWQGVIEAALSDCDAMVVFQHPGFNASRWCDQEVGWAMGRRRPLIPLFFGEQPYGFMGKYQSQNCDPDKPNVIADTIAEWLAKNQSLHARLSTSFADGFARTTSWNFTRSIAPLMEKIQAYSDDDLNAIEAAAKSNEDVSRCDIWGTAGPDWVASFVKARRAPATADPWAATEPPF